MNMSEEVTGVTLQVTEKAVTTGLNATTRIAEMIARLFREMLAMSRESKSGKPGSGSKEKVRDTDLTDLKPGYAAYKDLVESARKSGDTITSSEHGMSREDMKAVCRKAKKYGIPVAFKNPKGKDNIYACVRGSDLPLFKQICTEVIKDKIAEKPEKLGNIRCEVWEVPFLTAEMKKLDVAAMFPTSDEGSFCLYEKKDEKLIRCAREEYAKKFAALERDTAFTKDEDGFYTITDKRTGKTVSFDEVPTRDKLSEQLQSQFGYDENKANMCVSKFAQEMLHGKERERLISPLIQEEFSGIASVVDLEGEHPLASHYQCWHMTPKDDSDCIVFRDGESGRFAVLEPLKMSNRKMRTILKEQLGITDKEMLSALTDKADRLAHHYASQELDVYSADRVFRMDDFTQEQLVEDKHIGASGQEYVTRLKPIDSVEQTIDRSGQNMFGAQDRDAFTVDATFTAMRIDADGKGIESKTSSKLELTLADRKTGMNILTEMYKERGIPEATAREMAKSVFRKAELQSPERVVRIEEVRADTMKVVYGRQSSVVSISDKQAAARQITERFGIPSGNADDLVEKADEMRAEAIRQRVDAVRASSVSFSAAMNHMTDREQRSIDSMIVCSADDPAKHIVVTGDHNGDRVVHHYAVFNGEQKLGSYSDEHTTDTDGQPVRSDDGKTTVWTALKKEMAEQSGIDSKAVLTFRTEADYQQYLEDTKFLTKSQKETAPDIQPNKQTDSETIGQGSAGNGHEKHKAPTQTKLDEVAAAKAPTEHKPVGSVPMPEAPKPKTHRR